MFRLFVVLAKPEYTDFSKETSYCEKQKRYFKNTLKHSKRFDHVTDDVMSLFWSRQKLSVRTLLSRKFSLPCDERLTLYSSRPSLPHFSLMFITPFNFRCRTSTGYF